MKKKITKKIIKKTVKKVKSKSKSAGKNSKKPIVHRKPRIRIKPKPVFSTSEFTKTSPAHEVKLNGSGG